MIDISDKLKGKINKIPKKPGIYKMLDVRGNIIYVGKSKFLSDRVKSYFVSNPKWEKVKRMVNAITDIEYIVTDTHLEARLLECSLIKTIRPVFNSQMKHDGGYVFLKLKNFNQYNALSVVSEREENSYGPFRSKFHMNEIINSLKNIYPIRSIDGSYFFEYHLFPVTLNIKEFNENKKCLKDILTDKANAESFIEELKIKMKQEAAFNNFEIASIYKNLIDNINYINYTVNKYEDLMSSDLLVTIPFDGGYKLFYISNADILRKETFKNIAQTNIDLFCNAAKNSTAAYSYTNEKSLIDFRDIIYSEILSLPENSVVKINM